MSELTIVGHSVKRRDVAEKVSGSALYTADIRLPHMLFARCLRSTVAHARIVHIDTRRALALPGVKAVLTHHDVPRVLHHGAPHPRSVSVTEDQYILDHKVRYWGEVVAAVAAVSEEIAEEALALIAVTYEELPVMTSTEAAEAAGAMPIHSRGPDGNLVAPPVRCVRGDVEQGFAEADFIIEGTYVGGRPTPAYMEPNACLCNWQNLDGEPRLTVHISTQAAFMVRGIMAQVLGLPLNRVRVLCDHMGGGFGAKQDLFQAEFLCALLSKQTHQPVLMEFTRKETFLGGRSRHPVRIWLKQGFKRDGSITARQASLVFNSGAYGSHGPGVTTVGTLSLTSLYRCSNALLEGRCVYTNAPIAGAYRGYGVVQAYYALDIQLDEAAQRLGMDPAMLKLHNAVREGDLAPSGHPIIGHGLEDCIRRGMQEVAWHGRPKQTRTASGAVRHGWGMGCEMHGSSAYPGIKEQGNATLRMNEDGTAVLLTGAAGLGTGAHTALAQIVAEELGLTFESVSVVHGDTDAVPWDIGAFASHTTYMVGTAARMAAADVKQQLLDRAAVKFEVPAAELTVRAGTVIHNVGHNVIHKTGHAASARSMLVRDVMGVAMGQPAAHLVGHGTYTPTKSYSFAAHFVQVAVDTQTGMVDVLQVVPVHEIGRVVHPIAAAGQIEGGIQQGIGHTLSENHEIDAVTGRSLNASFVDYKMPLAMDMPPIRTILLETAPDPGGPWGAKGVGEDPIIAIGPAIANAIFDATGVRFRHYPITPEQVLDGLRALKKDAA